MDQNPVTILQSVGRTPLIKFQRLSAEWGIELLGKAEFFNPMGSVKDRIGREMIEEALATGRLKPGMTVVEPTSGNTGIALAFVCAANGFKCILTMPETMSVERRTLLLQLGAELVLTPGPLGIRGAIAKAKEIIAQDPAKYFTPSQFDNPANPRIHLLTTAPEIWIQSGFGNFDVFVAGVGTGGTISACGQYFKENKPGIRVFAVEPAESAVLSGGKPGPHKIQGLGAGFVPKNYNAGVVDGVVPVTSDESIAMAKRIILEEGIPAGISTGAAVVAVQKLALKPEFKGKRFVTILPSYTERYLSTLLGEDARTRAIALTAQPVDDQILKTVPLGAVPNV